MNFRGVAKRIPGAVGLVDLARKLGRRLGCAERLQRDLIMPKYQFHAPMDYQVSSGPPDFPPPVRFPGEPLPVPPAICRPGYAPGDDAHYLAWGKADYAWIKGLIEKHLGMVRGASILDFGCSSGRVLRHFVEESSSLGWNLHGIDIQAFLIEWMRQYFPTSFRVTTGSAFPHLPYRDATFDVIYGISVFTHTKYLWDMWLNEFKRVLRPGGLCIQTVQCESAWRFYHQHRHEDWVRAGHPTWMLERPEMDRDFFFHGDGLVSQTFYREEVVKRYWGRYMKVVDFLPPQQHSYQNVIVLKNED